jgi:hypothetical protein
MCSFPARLSLLALMVGLAALAVPDHARMQDAPAPARTEAEMRQLLQGAWYLVQADATARQRIDQGIERCVSEMNYFLQNVARDQMRANTPINRRIDIGFEGTSSITVNFDQRFSYTTRPGVAQSFDLPDGSSVNVRQYFRDDHFEQYFEATLGRRWSVYRLSADGQTMTVSATQQGPMMPVPMHFTLDYRQRS